MADGEEVGARRFFNVNAPMRLENGTKSRGGKIVVVEWDDNTCTRMTLIRDRQACRCLECAKYAEARQLI